MYTLSAGDDVNKDLRGARSRPMRESHFSEALIHAVPDCQLKASHQDDVACAGVDDAVSGERR